MTVDQTFVLTGLHYKTDEPISVKIRDGMIQAIERIQETHLESNRTIAPGLIDLQVNGFAGVDFNLGPDSVHDNLKALQLATDKLLAHGTTTYCPTIITGSFEDMLKSMKAIRDACESDARVNDCIAGIHMEGPYISSEDGPRGAHDLQHVRDPDWDEFMALQEASGNRICLVTLAPERPGAIDMISRLAGAGIKVCIGHTAAEHEHIEQAAEAGATISTHLGNGAHPLIRRHPNYIWSQLAEDRLYAGIIADGHHLHPSVLKVMVRVKRDKHFLVSDSVMLAKQPPGIYETRIGGKVELTPQGRLQLANQPNILAGSTAALIDCVEFYARSTNEGLPIAIDKASVVPATILEQERIGKLEEGCQADLLVYERHPESSQLSVCQVFKRGKEVYSSVRHADVRNTF